MSRWKDSPPGTRVPRYKGLAAYGHARRPLGCTFFFHFTPLAADDVTTDVFTADWASGADRLSAGDRDTLSHEQSTAAAPGGGSHWRSPVNPWIARVRLSWAVGQRISGAARRTGL